MNSHVWQRLGLMLACAWLGIGLAACSSGLEPEVTVAPANRCVDDSPQCVSRRQAELKSILADRERKWTREPATADHYAGGVRLFAYKTRKREMSCPELAHARREAEAGPGALRGPGGRHLTPAQISRGVMLAGEVSRELSIEMRRRCPA